MSTRIPTLVMEHPVVGLISSYDVMVWEMKNFDDFSIYYFLAKYKSLGKLAHF